MIGHLDTRLKLAARNVFRNKRRTILNVLMIAGAIAAIINFEGFASSLIQRLSEVAVNSQYGHLQIASDKTWNLKASESPKDRLISLSPDTTAKISKLPAVEYVSGRLSFYGLITSGDHSLSAHGVGFDTAVESHMRDQMKMVEGRNLTPTSKFEIIAGAGLQSQLGLKVGDSVTLLAYTFDGSVNAIDAELVGVFRNGLSEIDDSTFYIPLATSQKLMDTTSVERMAIQLKDYTQLEATRQQLTDLAIPGTGVRTWINLAGYYRQVNAYFHKQNTIVKWILMLLALLAIANTIGMSISERTGEIGTLRAMGDTRRDIVVQFLLEGLLLGIIGAVCGVVLGVVTAEMLTAAHIPILPPGASEKVPVVVELLPSAFRDASIMMCLMAMAATLVPAYRASQMGIVDALKRNI